VPKVSIVTAAYNHVRFVRQSVESALNQTYRDFEHIVIDDGSTDGTADVLKSFGNRIKYIRQENRGAHATINAAIRESSGEYIAILDSDDAWLPQKLERQMPAFEQTPKPGMVYSQACIIDEQGQLRNNGAPAGKALADSGRAFEDLLKDNAIPVLTAVIGRDCLEDVGFFRENLKALSDWDLWLRIALKWPIAFVAEPLALYRIHGNNTFTNLSNSGEVDRERLMVMRDAPANISSDDPETENRRNEIKARFAYTVIQQTYGLSCRRQYSRAVKYLRFALSISPNLLRDLPAAVRLEPALLAGRRPFHFMTNLVLGCRDD
jgi:glycosyltransferase involved in cell wall biosynthesis